MDLIEVEKIIDESSKEIAQKILDSAHISRNEAELRTKFSEIINHFADLIDVDTTEVREEYILARGRADAVYNRLIIEYEPPRSLTSSNSTRNNQHAIGQVKTYIEDIDKRERRHKARLLGVTTDGSWIIYAKFTEDKKQPWDISKPQEVNEYSIRLFLRSFASLVSGAALIPDNLERDFGTKSLVARKSVETFYKSLLASKNEKVEVLFKQWQRHFDQVTGYSESSTKFTASDLAFMYGMRGSDFKLLPMFFAIHSYYATFIKLLALQIAGYYTFSGRLPLKDYEGLESEKLLEQLKDLEEGGVFRDVGINNFLEGDFFSWYIEIWDESIEKSIREIIEKLNSYDPVTMEVDPELTRDLLKMLYQQLVPKELRHDLGEYYTPDWLAERLLNQIQFNGDPDKRVLDPACGSGTFLILALKRIREYSKNKRLRKEDLLQKILNNVAGIDLNPLAVISARTNFLMAISDLLPYKPKEGINIPIFLADSILTPAQYSDLFTQSYRVKTVVGDFDIPIKIVEQGQIENLAELLEQSVRRRESIDDFLDLYKSKVRLSEKDSEEGKGVIELIYRKLLELEEKGIDHIWARIIKNSFAPLFLGKFDYVIGNPPWINWESLPEEYRNSTKPMWKNYGLFTLSGLDARMGGGKKDLSIIFIYVGVERYLKEGGRLAFIITQSLFKTGGAGEGFRRFCVGEKGYFKILAVDDMVELKPFEGVANRTAVFTCQKGNKTQYPVTYNYWRKKTKGTGIKTTMSLAEVSDIATYFQLYAEPVNLKKYNSPWITARRGALKAIRKVISKSDYIGREGVNTGGLNSAYWINIIKRLPNGNLIIENFGDTGRAHVTSYKVEIEPDFVYPLIRGRNISRWKFESTNYIILPVLPKEPEYRNAYPEDLMKKKYPLTYQYFEKFKNRLLQRSGYKKYLTGQPFYAVYNIGEYTFSSYRVAWARQAKLLECSLIPQNSIPDQTVQFISFNSEDEANFACALLNSTFSVFIPLSCVTDITTRIMNSIGIKKYSNSILDIQLSQLSKELHSEGVKNINDPDLEKLAGKYWNLSEEESLEIIKSYKEMV